MCVPKTSNYIQTRKKMSNPIQEPPVFSKAPSRDLKDMGHGTNDNIQIKIKMPNPHQEPQASSNVSKLDTLDMDLFCTIKIKIKSKIWNMIVSNTSDHGRT